jgi:hypothetical protein
LCLLGEYKSGKSSIASILKKQWEKRLSQEKNKDKENSNKEIQQKDTNEIEANDIARFALAKLEDENLKSIVSSSDSKDTTSGKI